MATKVDNLGVEQYLSFMQSRGDKRTESFAELEIKFGLTPYKDPGNRAKKLWRRFVKSNVSLEEFMVTRFGHYAGDGTDGVELLESVIPQGVTEFTTSNGGTVAYYSAPTDRMITTEAEALEASGVDLKKWRLHDWKWRTWNTSGKEKRQIGTDAKGNPTFETYMVTKTNYGIQMWFKLIDKTEAEITVMLGDQISKAIKQPKITRTKGIRGVGVVNIADLHIGAQVYNLLKSPDYDIGKVVEYLNYIADETNLMQYKEVHVNMLGDYFESISGHNHLSTFKSLSRDGWGAEIVIKACEILAHFLSRINNLKGVNMISGNHDRMSADSKEDNDGSMAHILFELIRKEKNFNGVNFLYSAHVLPVEIDGIMYILTHGHQKLNAKTTEKIMWRYGVQGKFNLLLEAHLHTRKTVKSWVSKAAYFDDEVIVATDEADYRRITVPSLFTGNPYSMMLGYSTNPGFILTESNGRGGIRVTDISL